MISRRALSASAVAIPVGIIGGLLVRRMTSPQSSIRFLGRRDSMIACLDIGNERALFLLGESDAGLLPFLPQLLTVGRTRIDLIIASHQWLTTAGIRDELDLETTTTLSLQEHVSLPPIVGNVTAITSAQSIELGDGTIINLSVEGTLDRDGTDPLITVEIEAEGTRLVLANHESALDAISTTPHLLAIPGEVTAATIERLRPILFAGTMLHDGSSIREMQMFYNEPVGVAISDGSITVLEGQFSS